MHLNEYQIVAFGYLVCQCNKKKKKSNDGFKKFVLKISSFKFGQVEIASKNFFKQKQVADVFKIDVNKVVASHKSVMQ